LEKGRNCPEKKNDLQRNEEKKEKRGKENFTHGKKKTELTWRKLSFSGATAVIRRSRIQKRKLSTREKRRNYWGAGGTNHGGG